MPMSPQPDQPHTACAGRPSQVRRGALCHQVLMATRLDGQPMPVRGKGPLFMVDPCDASADLRSGRFSSRSAWQLRRLEIR